MCKKFSYNERSAEYVEDVIDSEMHTPAVFDDMKGEGDEETIVSEDVDETGVDLAREMESLMEEDEDEEEADYDEDGDEEEDGKLPLFICVTK
jgi:hypothetical protein